MAYMAVIAPCAACHHIFSFNPDLVPSIRMKDGRFDPTGTREPICRDCVARANASRKENGLNPIEILTGAYEPEECA